MRSFILSGLVIVFLISTFLGCAVSEKEVEVTLPESLFIGEDGNIDDAIAEATERGVREVIVNDDDTLTYKMSKSLHEEMIKEIEVELHEYIEQLKTDTDSIKDVTYNNSFSEFTLVVDQESFQNSWDGFVVIGFGITGMYYQVFGGVDMDDVKVTISIENVDTGEIINTYVYPDDLEE